ncbi:heterokaryon incompatibility protein [Colletotrichum chrysophilum]|uniref:Heterokaryon incompatibility protein n=1 Tax=Colletotrichum chrysophilum TaxID=1836956 RepID=A0AAD9EDJ8_9PEZI|nr:heterokaryon incompatibility protein [Colletotrichum chrysophilum]
MHTRFFRLCNFIHPFVIMKLVLIHLLGLASIVVAIVVTPGGTDYNAIKNALTAAAVKDGRLTPVDALLIAPTKRRAADPVEVWSAVGTFTNGPAGLETGVILTTGQAASAAPGVTLDGSWSYGQDRMVLCPVAPSCEYSILRMNITAQSGVRALRVNYLFAEDGRRFQLDAAQLLTAGNNPVPESVVVAKRDPRMKPGVPGEQLGLSYKITSGVFSFDVALGALEDETAYWRTLDENSWTPLSFAPRRHVAGGKAYTVLYVYVENQFISLYRFFDLFPAKDSVADWDAEASSMRNIYANAFCNVAATASNDPDGGLFRERDTDTIRPGIVESTLTTGTLESNLIFTSNYWYSRLYRGTLHHRGWVFQECFLAPRLLYFTQDQIMWECGQTHKCEGFVDGVPGHEPSVDQSQKTERTLREWTHLVMQYSECHFTRPEDRLNAFSGVANLFQEATGYRYLAGMWEEELLHQLCWTATEPGPRLSTKYRAPSWSWTSIDGPVYIRGPNAKKAIDFFVQVEDVGVITKGVDPTLNVVDGVLTLHGPFGTARYAQRSETEHLIVHLENGCSPQKMNARWLPDTTDDEKLPRSGIIQLVFCKREAACEGSPEPYFIDCIVVEGAQEEGGKFRRAGILRIDEERDVSLANTMLLSNQIEKRIITLV